MRCIWLILWDLLEVSIIRVLCNMFCFFRLVRKVLIVLLR